MAERGFLSDILQRVAGAGRLGLGQRRTDALPLVALCEELLGDQGEASGLVTALEILDRFEALDTAEKHAFFLQIVQRFGVDDDALASAIAAWQPGDTDAARHLHFAAEPQSQNLVRILNRVPGATARLVAMRADILAALPDEPALKGLDQDFQHLFSSWFNRGFLEIRRIDWDTSASVLEKIIAYEAVHEINGWDDLRQRVADPDRQLFAFFHPAMASEPLIFVEVALTEGIPGEIAPILRPDRVRIDPKKASTAVFYSISNCQKGLRGISFGNFLIKQVVSELTRDLPGLDTFVTLSPVPGLRKWIADALDSGDPLLTTADRDALLALDGDAPPSNEIAARSAARYLTGAKRPKGTVFDPVAHFHLGNGATLHAVHAGADRSETGLANSWGVMVNYLYDGNLIETNHHAYVTDGTIAASAKVRALAKT